MATYTMNINPVSFDLIKRGAKTLEVRLRTGEATRYRAGDTLLMRNRDVGDTVSCQITAVVAYTSLESLIRHEDINQAGTFTDAGAFVERMRSFQTEAEEKESGLLAIHLTDKPA